MNRPLIMFHVWSGEKMPDAYRRNIEANHAILRPGDRHVLISDEAIACCEQLSYSEYKQAIGEDDDFNRLFADRMAMNRRYEWLPKETAESDFFRLHYALKNPGTIYADCDLRFVTAIPDLDEAYSWFGSNGNNLDCFAFVDFGLNGLLVDIVKLMENTSIVQLCGISHLIVSHLSSAGKDKAKELASDLFIHGK